MIKGQGIDFDRIANRIKRRDADLMAVLPRIAALIDLSDAVRSLRVLPLSVVNTPAIQYALSKLKAFDDTLPKRHVHSRAYSTTIAAGSRVVEIEHCACGETRKLKKNPRWTGPKTTHIDEAANG